MGHHRGWRTGMADSSANGDKPAGRKYEMVYETLRERISRPDIDFDRPIATEEKLAEELGVSRVTVRKALKLLEDQGLVVRRRRLGTFPARRVARVGTGASISSLRDQARSLATHSEISLIACRRVVAPEYVRRELDLGPQERVLRFERVRRDSTGPLAHLTSFITLEVAALISRAELLSEPPLVLLMDKGVHIDRSEQSISAEIARDRIARWLEVRPGDALVRTTRVLYRDGKTPVSYMIARLRADRYELHYTLSNRGDAGAPEVWRVDR